MFIKTPGHMTISGKNLHTFSSPKQYAEPIAKTFDIHKWGLEYYNLYINHDPVLTLTYSTARSTYVLYAEIC